MRLSAHCALGHYAWLCFERQHRSQLLQFDHACEGEPVTSMKELLGREIALSNVEDRIIENLAAVFEMSLEREQIAVS